MNYQSVIDALTEIAQRGDYSLTVNGSSKHLNTDEKFNESNKGFGLLAEKDGKFLTAGQYKNSYNNNSVYVGGGIKKRFGNEYYVEPGIIGGAVTGYGTPLMPLLMPMLSFGKKGLGSINAMYAPKTKVAPSTIMMNLSIPFK